MDIKGYYLKGKYAEIANKFCSISGLYGLTTVEIDMVAWSHHHNLNATIKEIPLPTAIESHHLIIEMANIVIDSGDVETKISGLRLRPLHLWAIGETDVAIDRIESAIKLFPNDSGLWNTKGLLEIYGKKFKECVVTSAVIIGLSLRDDDYRTAGNGSRQMAIAVKESTDNIPAAIGWLSQAVRYWKISQGITEWDATMHITGAENMAHKWGGAIS